ncbi:type I glyceraldehyde-3-phosphate dehydrogenase [Nitrospina gracilis]|uniref:type I glyceraldehyde-3-phosphate dehydrogenase n=1 Tax=Nitrospina gracilis TaxID=35801 RepID=UPI001F021161|nr:type I glyceraldehyde-3-phosphate dehydrogenase [Nitrospina gracilis]MCF8720717.1 glyceraldehyde 3-phosphate dehydrogenase [Nitrospina gracilis Nb-211]
MATKVGINGFGRIGRNVLKCIMNDKECGELVDVVAINDLTDAATLAHLYKYDSVQGVTKGEVKADGDHLVINGKKIKVLSVKDPAELPWKELGVDVVIESTGIFTKRDAAAKHLKAGAKKVIISAPATDPDVTVVLGVNEGKYDPKKHDIVSNASCTTNCLAPMVKVLNDRLKIKKGLMTTIHSYTNDQRILDLPHKDLRRARAANLSMIPTTTGAAKAVCLVLPELEGRLDGMAIRVPTPNVSLVDFVADVEKETTTEEVNAMFREVAEGELKGILRLEEQPLVSIDFNGDEDSSIIDGPSTKVMGKNMVKVLSWYDNEWGYSSRTRDILKFIIKKGI